jgi:hypothetical protein
MGRRRAKTAMSASHSLRALSWLREQLRMDLDHMLHHYFGTSDLAEASAAVQAGGIDRLQVDLGLETDRSRRLALWSPLYMLGQAPDLDVAFKEEANQGAARNLMDLLAAYDDT